MLEQNDPWLDKVTDSDVANPLSEVARRERTALLVCNLLLFAVVQVNLVPKKLSFMGIETGELNGRSLYILLWILIVYYFISFLMIVGAEYRAWRSKLESLRERRQLRAEFYLERRIARIMQQHEQRSADPEEARTAIAVLVSHFNLAQQSDWLEYRRLYEVRMLLDALVPIVLTIANISAAAYRQLQG